LGGSAAQGEEERRLVRVGEELGFGLYRAEGEEEEAVKVVGKDSAVGRH
jgi:hypothetical protein